MVLEALWKQEGAKFCVFYRAPVCSSSRRLLVRSHGAALPRPTPIAGTDQHKSDKRQRQTDGGDLRAHRGRSGLVEGDEIWVDGLGRPAVASMTLGAVRIDYGRVHIVDRAQLKGAAALD